MKVKEKRRGIVEMDR